MQKAACFPKKSITQTCRRHRAVFFIFCRQKLPRKARRGVQQASQREGADFFVFKRATRVSSKNGVRPGGVTRVFKGRRVFFKGRGRFAENVGEFGGEQRRLGREAWQGDLGRGAGEREFGEE